jgi:antitoxin (DNA-binding transcriptional repressor) of toxin-antitoxin stability system
MHMTIKTIEIDDSQGQFKDILILVRQGVEVILAQDNMPMARLVPISEATSTARVAGLHADAILMSDDFDAPLDDGFWLGQS